MRLAVCTFVVVGSVAAGNFTFQPFGSGQALTVREKHSQNATEIYVTNSDVSPVSLAFEVTGENVKTKNWNDTAMVVPANGEVLALSIEPQNPQVKWLYHYSYQWVRGDVNARQDPSVVYDLPYAAGSSHIVMQGFNGDFSHKGDSKYAVDFEMAEGTLVTAAREGVVVLIDTSHAEHGTDQAMLSKANVINILQPDNTVANYVHLLQNGNLVSVGQHVKRGDAIGYSGNTGYSTGPHLHFAVSRPYSIKYDKWETLPARFKTQDGKASVLQQGLRYAN